MTNPATDESVTELLKNTVIVNHKIMTALLSSEKNTSDFVIADFIASGNAYVIVEIQAALKKADEGRSINDVLLMLSTIIAKYARNIREQLKEEMKKPKGKKKKLPAVKKAKAKPKAKK